MAPSKDTRDERNVASVVEAGRPAAHSDGLRRAEDVAQRVSPRSAPRDPLRTAQCAVGEDVAAGRAMGELEPLAASQKVHGVVADDVPAA